MVEKIKQKFSVSTKKSLFKPIVIEVDGVVYKQEKITPEMITKVSKHEKGAKAGNMDSVMAQLNILLNVPVEILRNVDMRDLEKMMNYVSDRIFSPEKYEDDLEKKASGTKDVPTE